jgi:hypothetical protein
VQELEKRGRGVYVASNPCEAWLLLQMQRENISVVVANQTTEFENTFSGFLDELKNDPTTAKIPVLPFKSR